MIDKKILRIKKVSERTGLSQSSIYDLMKKKLFPASISLADNCASVGWLESDINEFIEQRIAKSRNKLSA